MTRHTPHPPAMGPDFGPGSSSPQRTAPRRGLRALRALGWLLVGSVTLVLGLGAGAWWWAGSETSLATALQRAAQFLPADQQLQARGVTGSLRSGGHIDDLRWSSPGLVVQATDLRLGWQLIPLLQRRLELGELHAAQVQITPLDTPQAAEPPAPPTALVLPLQIGLPFRVDRLEWAGTPAVQALGLAGDYRFDGQQHRLNIEQVALAQGRYTARATLDAQAPMALKITVDGTVHTPMPGNQAPLQIGAHATLEGTLATAAAQLQLQARLRPETGTTDTPLQADVQAAVAPWAPQPLQSATATLRALDLAALWPQAPTTQLQGTLQAGPTPGTAEAPAGWTLGVQLQNTLPGPWDTARLPLTALQAQATYDGTHWTLPGATASVGKGSVTLQGRYTPATGALEGTAQLRQLPPDALHTALAAAPLSGQVSARTQDGAVVFSADIGAADTPRAQNSSPGRAAPLHIRRLTTQGQWQTAPATSTAPSDALGTLHIQRLLLDALHARVEATDLRIHPRTQSAQGQLALVVPGATARASGQLAPLRGQGELQVQWADVARTQAWLVGLPWIGADLQKALQGASAQGAAQLTARWTGGWRNLAPQPGAPPPPGKNDAVLQASLNSPQLTLSLPPAAGTSGAPTAVQLRTLQASVSGTLAQATLALNAEARTGPSGRQQVRLQTRLSGGQASNGQWRAQIATLAVQAHDTRRPGPWALQLAAPLDLSARTDTPGGALQLQASAGQARLTGPLPGTVDLRWQPVRWLSGANAPMRLQTQGTLQGLPVAWLDALGLDSDAPAVPGSPAQPLLARLGLATSLLLDGEWNVDLGDTLRASASLRRSSGDLRILTGDAATAVVVQGSANAPAEGTPAGVRQAELSLHIDNNTLRTRLVWASERAGEIEASVSTPLALQGNAASLWPTDAPLQGQLRARLPDVGVWSALAPPGWRVRGTLDASATLSGTRSAPRWTGTLGADALAVRSLVDGVDLQDGRLRATLGGDRIDITEFQLKGGRGSRARIAGLSGNRTAAPTDGGTFSGTGHIRWGPETDGLSGITMDFQAEAQALQVQVRADRQLSVSGPVRVQWQQGQISLRGQLTADRATIILHDESAPSLGSDVVVRSAATDRAQAQAAAQAGTRAQTAKPPDIALTLNLGKDFALSGHGITTRLTGEIDLQSSTTPGAPPRITGEVQTQQGRYRAWGQMLDVETGLIRFNGPYNNPSLDILALRPNISVRAGVQVTGSALAPRVKLYSDPDLPDADKLSWVVLGRSAAGGGAEAAVLQQAALALLGRGGTNNPTANAARRLGLDEIGFKGPGTGDDATGAALTFGKRLSKDLYVTYERSLSGTLGTLYIFYDLSRRLTLRGQTGEKSAADLIYTVRYD